MGILDSGAIPTEGRILKRDRRAVHLVLSEREIAQAQLEGPELRGYGLILDQLAPDQPVPDEIIQKADILVLELRPDVAASLERLRAVRAVRPDLPVIAAIRDADITLVRTLLKQGVDDVITLPIADLQLTDSLKDVIDSRALAGSSGGQNGALISIIKSIGGVGATNVATHLASQLAERDAGGREACLFDLDVQFGNAASYLGVSKSPTLTELLEGGFRVDGDFLRTVATRLGTGLNLVPAPADIVPLESIDEAQLGRIIDTARHTFDHVVLDLPSNWTNWTLTQVARSDVALLVVNLTIAGLRQGKRQLQLLASQGINLDHVKIVVNRVEKRLFKTIDLDDAAQALGHPVDFSIQNDFPLVNSANDQGVLLWDLRPKSKLAKDFETISAGVAELAARTAA